MKLYRSCWKTWFILVKSVKFLDNNKFPIKELFECYKKCWVDNAPKEEAYKLTKDYLHLFTKTVGVKSYLEYFWELDPIQPDNMSEEDAFMYLYKEMKSLLKDQKKYKIKDDLSDYLVFFDPFLYKLETESDLFD
jgi:hypothetical protein